ncbi:cell wall hydrolase [Phenylobacterium sp.]|uniref:cell wall hydrolase n=1 Tax=Phenylobacterium sp. TaxID=1871053 RepID=UPI0035B41D7E
MSHKTASGAVALQLAGVWLASGLLVVGAAPAPGGAPAARSVDKAMVALTANHQAEVVKAVAVDPPTVLRLQDLTPDQARVWNASNPVSKAPNPAAKPFHLDAVGMLDEARAVDCLAAAVYYEAGYESLDGQRAVAQVVLNRLRHPAYPKTVCGVVFQGSERMTGCQFTFTCDGSLKREPTEAGWERSRQVAEAALDGYVMKKVGNATHYHAVYVAPYWSPNLVKVATIGAHVFYRWTGGWGLPPAFSGSYAGNEADSVKIAALDRISGGATVEIADPAPARPMAAEPPKVDVQPAATVAAASKPIEMVSAADVAKDAADIVPAEDLDWTGQPKDRGPARIAMPSMSF